MHTTTHNAAVNFFITECHNFLSFIESKKLEFCDVVRYQKKIEELIFFASITLKKGNKEILGSTPLKLEGFLREYFDFDDDDTMERMLLIVEERLGTALDECERIKCAGMLSERNL